MGVEYHTLEVESSIIIHKKQNIFLWSCILIRKKLKRKRFCISQSIPTRTLADFFLLYNKKSNHIKTKVHCSKSLCTQWVIVQKKYSLENHTLLLGRLAQRKKMINQFGLWEMFWGCFYDSKLPRMKFYN